MTARILLRTPRDPFVPADAHTVLRKNLIANNVGNLVFAQATHRILSRHDVKIVPGRSMPRRRDVYRSKLGYYDHYVLPLANAFRPAFASHLEQLTTAIRAMKAPVTVLGVGAQAPLDGEAKAKTRALAPLVRKFVSAVLDNGPSIGVRGEYTRDYLASLGFGDEHIRIIGCPSLFWDGPELPTLRPVPELHRNSPIAVTVSPYVREMGPILTRTLRRHPNATYFAQDHQTLSLMLGEPYRFPRAGKRAPTRPNHLAFREDRTVFCLDPKVWFDELSHYDFAFGTRIHGTIAALLAGTPAVLLAHDSRTLELAEFFELPYQLITDVSPRVHVNELASQADWSGYEQGHQARWGVFEAFLNEHALRHAFSPGGNAAGFDARLAAAGFPPPVRTAPAVAASASPAAR
ncbi:Polysaccharide pyruvyl transferase [Micrococcales bacterium KH10]|nr:Polysaccharide pyruvyl transferase [Micrococcales bacterium KH10]